MWPFRFIPQGETRIPSVHIRRADEFAMLPTKRLDDSTSFNLYSNVLITIPPGAVKEIPTGLYMEIPPNYFGQIKSCPFLVESKKLAVKPKIIDSDFCNMIYVTLLNIDSKEIIINVADMVAQIMFFPDFCPHIVESSILTSIIHD